MGISVDKAVMVSGVFQVQVTMMGQVTTVMKLMLVMMSMIMLAMLLRWATPRQTQ